MVWYIMIFVERIETALAYWAFSRFQRVSADRICDIVLILSCNLQLIENIISPKHSGTFDVKFFMNH